MNIDWINLTPWPALAGSLLFGAGRGLAGHCPGPAVASLALGGVKPLRFFGAMLAGMGMFEWLERRRMRRSELPAPA